jgi:hypothetical protein
MNKTRKQVALVIVTLGVLASSFFAANYIDSGDAGSVPAVHADSDFWN